MKKNKNKTDEKKLEKKEKKNKKDKIVTITKIISVICLIVLIVDVGFFVYTKYKVDARKTFFYSLNGYAYQDKIYYGVGSINDEKVGKYEQAVLRKFDSNHKEIWNKVLKTKYNGTFHNVAIDGDNILAVGSFEKNKEQNEEKVRTALFVKYDKDGKILFKKTMQILGNSRFINVLVVDDGYIVVGQSIFPNNVLGNADNGGAIIVKYSKDGEILWQDNTGGNKSGLFNDVIQDGDYLYAVGKDATRYGMIAKYTLNGEKIKAVSYAKTDTLGFTSVVKFNDKLICGGAKKLKQDDEYDHDTDGLLVAYNDQLEKIDEVTYKDTKKGLERFNRVIVDKDQLVVVGHEAIVDKENSTANEYAYNYTSMILKYDSNLKMKKEKIYKEDIDNYFSDVKLIDGKYIVSAYTRYKNNRYKLFFLEYDRGLK